VEHVRRDRTEEARRVSPGKTSCCNNVLSFLTDAMFWGGWWESAGTARRTADAATRTIHAHKRRCAVADDAPPRAGVRLARACGAGLLKLQASFPFATNTDDESSVEQKPTGRPTRPVAEVDAARGNASRRDGARHWGACGRAARRMCGDRVIVDSLPHRQIFPRPGRRLIVIFTWSKNDLRQFLEL
jgi:hypothetical protein